MIERAAQIAAQIDHPVYDCLYIACAEATGSTLITADRRLTDAVANRGLDVDVQYIEAKGVADSIRSAATRLIITQDKVAKLVAAYDLLDATKENVLSELIRGSARPVFISNAEWSRIHDSPAGKRLQSQFLQLNDEERIDLLALGWLGQGNSGTEWQPIFERACAMIDGYSNDDWRYVIHLGGHWREGFKRLTGISL